MLAKSNAFMKEANLIGGEWVAADGGETIEVNNPATGQIIGTVPMSGKAETKRAIEAAHRAFDGLAGMTAAERANILRRMQEVMMDNQQALAELLTIEMGKPLAESMGGIAIGGQYLLWFAEEGRRVYGDIIPSPWADRRIMVRKEPVGVVAAITPWNFPSSMLARKIGPAIAAGCTSVIKPAKRTPYSGLAWGLIADEAGLPNGAMNIVTGSSTEIGKEVCANPLVRKITFTGSTAVGKILMKQCASTVKKVSMELGGNAPVLVFEDADLDLAADIVTGVKFSNAGQICVSPNRVFVADAAREAFAKKKNLRLLLTGDLPDPRRGGLSIKPITGGLLVQSRDNGAISEADLKVVTERQPTEQELKDCLFAWTVARHVKSNAIVYAKDGATAGIGAGQMNRRDSSRIAAMKAEEAAEKYEWDQSRAVGSAVASDAFFPFADGLLAAAEAGATAIIQPGGSMRDEEVIAAANEAGLAMVFTGMRHFRH